MNNITILLFYLGVFVLFCLVFYLLIWAFLGLKAYLNYYYSKSFPLSIYEVVVTFPDSKSFSHTIHANSYSMALKIYESKYIIKPNSSVSIKEVVSIDKFSK